MVTLPYIPTSTASRSKFSMLMSSCLDKPLEVNKRDAIKHTQTRSVCFWSPDQRSLEKLCPTSNQYFTLPFCKKRPRISSLSGLISIFVWDIALQTHWNLHGREIAKETSKFLHQVQRGVRTLYFMIFPFRATLKLVGVSPLHVSRGEGFFSSLNISTQGVQ